MLTLNTTAVVLGIITSVVIPLLSSLIVHEKWPAEIAGIVTLLISTGSGFVTDWQAEPHNFDWRHASLLALASFITAAISRIVLWKDTKIDAALLAVGSGPSTPPAAG